MAVATYKAFRWALEKIARSHVFQRGGECKRERGQQVYE